MTTRKETISKLIDAFKTQLLGMLETDSEVAVDSSLPLRGAVATTDWRNVELFYSARLIEATAIRCEPDPVTYDDLVLHLVDQRGEPLAGKRDTRKQHARLSLDRFVARGLLKRDGDIVSLATGA